MRGSGKSRRRWATLTASFRFSDVFEYFYFFSFWRKRRFPSLARWFQRNLPGGIPGTRCWLFCHWTVRRAWVIFEIIATDKWKFCCGESEMLEKKTVNRWGANRTNRGVKAFAKNQIAGENFLPNRHLQVGDLRRNLLKAKKIHLQSLINPSLFFSWAFFWNFRLIKFFSRHFLSIIKANLAV